MKINQIDTLFDIFTKMDDIFLQEFGYEFNQKYLSKYEINNVRFFLDTIYHLLCTRSLKTPMPSNNPKTKEKFTNPLNTKIPITSNCAERS